MEQNAIQEEYARFKQWIEFYKGRAGVVRLDYVDTEQGSPLQATLEFVVTVELPNDFIPLSPLCRSIKTKHLTDSKNLILNFKQGADFNRLVDIFSKGLPIARA